MHSRSDLLIEFSNAQFRAVEQGLTTFGKGTPSLIEGNRFLKRKFGSLKPAYRILKLRERALKIQRVDIVHFDPLSRRAP